MGARKHRDIAIRGTVYPTVMNAAVALGVQEQTVLKAIQAGRLDGVGLGQSHPVARPVKVRGKVYETCAAAAKDLRLSRNAIWNAIEAGREDRVGLPGKPHRTVKPVRIGPHQFSSMVEASRALGFKSDYVSHALRHRRASSMERLMAAAMRLEVAQRPLRVAA